MNTNAQVASHYTAEDVVQRIDALLREQGIDPAHPTLDSLAPYDNFHSRGLEATLDLIALANFPAGARVLDIGGGLGGPARVLADRAKVQVTVLDLTPSFIEQGRILTERVGMSDQVAFELGDGTAMPFADESFDGVWTQHSTMNIPDKRGLYSEIHRVLKPGGRLVMQEVMAANGEPVVYPVPWAVTADLSFLSLATEMRASIVDAGFRELAWENETQKVLGALGPPQGGAPSQQPAGLTVLFGPAFLERIRNMGSNFRSGTLVVVQALFERV
ncbi:MAG TPA: class I SAM-dependent methyltransferase [Thermomicrobiales bacterium]|nr:class I SAM-dependent methyltransferase [Thermomicrobiales bacterium]